MKANDIPELLIIETVRAVAPNWQTRWNIHAALSQFPYKVVNAKLRSMVKRGLLNGCASHDDCRGDFTIPEPNRCLPNNVVHAN